MGVKPWESEILWRRVSPATRGETNWKCDKYAKYGNAYEN
jgi:hypothetical protein